MKVNFKKKIDYSKNATNKVLQLILLFFVITSPIFSQSTYHQVSTRNTILAFTGDVGKTLLFQYYGNRIANLEQFEIEDIGLNKEAYPTFGIYGEEEKALRVVHSDGNLSTKLVLLTVEKIVQDNNITVTCFKLKDEVYNFYVDLYYKSFYNEDIIETWSEIHHSEEGTVALEKFASFYLPIKSFNAWLTHYHGNWGNEFNITDEPLTRGMKVIKNRDGVKNTDRDNPSFMLSLNGKATETDGEIIAGSLAWTGNYKISFDHSLQNDIYVIAGINEDGSRYKLPADEKFITPELILTYTNNGKGQISRTFHAWARKYKLMDGFDERPIILNSWEGVYMDIEEEVMFEMMNDFSELGGEMFVMDDGWFGNEYPRNNGSAGLGDWEVNKKKLPNGLDPLIKSARKNNMKFGIWIEPEMVNANSVLAKEHPNWIVHQENRETVKGRGESQMLLDLSNPEVQNFIYQTVHSLLENNEGIEYIKWDANHFMSNFGSSYLPKDKQSHIQIEYHKGLRKTIERIRASHPDIIMQVCASGGGRVNYGFLPYFHEFWTSDNTSALSRVYIQWGTSHFYPSIAMASHVSASPNHQTHSSMPFKFRFDLAMTGRFGLEMQPSTFNEKEKKFAIKAIQNYKEIRPVIQFGDLYRLISPYDNYGLSSLMYVDSSKTKAVFFAFNLDKNLRQEYPALKMDGLDPHKEYILTEINRNSKTILRNENARYSGELLMNMGIPVNMSKVYQSVVLKVEEYNGD